MTTTGGLADAGRMPGAEIKHLPQSIPPDLRLVAQNNSPVSQSAHPSWPSCRALDRTQHAALGSRVANPVFGRKAKPIQLRLHGRVAGGAHHSHLDGTQGLPLPDQVANDGSPTPRQQQLGLAHSPGCACCQEHHSKRELASGGWHCHRTLVPQISAPDASTWSPAQSPTKYV